PRGPVPTGVSGRPSHKDHRTVIDILARNLGPEEAQVMQTMWEAAEERGREQGRPEALEKGLARVRLEGRRELFVRMLQRRSGQLPAGVLARIECADDPSFGRWPYTLLFGPSLEALFPPV